jgi:hypothetical protein
MADIVSERWGKSRDGVRGKWKGSKWFSEENARIEKAQ